ncbi:MAG: glutamine-hydrolyzing carbamoyl-phosphate synthase small subunit [Phycisphaeraceae bacterium]|nr:glutamine-hydrolyzing carbamoyl-phosphate synthase small subunit [Phycisphaeraceae bacterium]
MTRSQQPTAYLALEDGTLFHGRAFGATDRTEPVTGEVVFNTSMTGYQEILTDPSYRGQIVTMTYPHIGNYGINTEDIESRSIQAAGFVVRQVCAEPSNYRSQQTLDQYLRDEGVVGISGIDTRSLTRRIRIHGAMRGALGVNTSDPQQLVEAARQIPVMAGQNLARLVSATEPSNWQQTLESWPPIQGQVEKPDRRFKVVALDCGAKSNILRHLAERDCDVTVLPHDASAEQIRERKPDGLFISNGPGDPAPVTTTIETLRSIGGTVPTFGICLGHQLLGLSLGAETFKLRFGHRGGNQPVRNLATGKVEITSQNHGFAVEIDSLEKAGATPTHVNCNDQTCEGFRHADLPIFAVQYHPEASPGPHDASYLFDCFIEMMLSGQSPTAEQMDTAQRQRNRV